MKQLILSLSFLIAASSANAAQCKVKLEDIGTIIGHGATKDLAFEDAATKCYEKRESRFGSRRSASAAALDEDTKLTLIDLCINVKCS